MKNDNSAFDNAILQEQLDKVNELYAKFSPSFEEKVRTYASASQIFDFLLAGGDVYKALEHMIESNEQLLTEFKKVLERSPPPPIIAKAPEWFWNEQIKKNED